jgi:hypothetical protein
MATQPRKIQPKGAIVAQTFCELNGHDYQKVTDKDRDYWVVYGRDTYVYKTYLCSKCGEVKDIQIGIWANFIPESKAQRKLKKA